MDPNSIRVHAPDYVVFLCGGALTKATQKPKGFRDVFFRAKKAIPSDYRIILAEEAEPLKVDAGYGDLLSFESDIAQVVGLIVLFVESAGSLAELGAFSALPQVSPSLLVIVTDSHYAQSSFIRNGPIKALENSHGDSAILSLDSNALGITGKNLKSLKQEELTATVEEAIKARLVKLPHYSKVDLHKEGHAILVLVGLCQEFGALKREEIKEFIERIGFDSKRLRNYLYCAELLGWVREIRKGNSIYFVGVAEDPAIDYGFRPDIVMKDKLRWRSDIRQYWLSSDRHRINAIADVTGVKT